LKRLQPLFILLALSLIVTLFPQKSDAATKKSLSIAVNDLVLPDAKAVYRDDKIYVPLRAVLEAFGYEITYDHEFSSVQFEKEDIVHHLLIQESMLETSEGYYFSEYPFVLIKQKTYVPLEMFEHLFFLLLSEIKLDMTQNRIDFKAMDAVNDEAILALVDGYYTRSIEPKDLFHSKINIYGGRIESYAFYQGVLEQLTNLSIGEITYESLSEASVVTHFTSITPGVHIEAEVIIHFFRFDSRWRIIKVDFQYKDFFLTKDYIEKHEALLESSPKEVNQVLEDVTRYYELNSGTDVKAALSTFSPLFLKRWSEGRRGFEWEEMLAAILQNPHIREDLLEAKVLYFDDQYAAVYVRVHITDLRQPKDGTVEQEERFDPYELEQILYLHLNDEKRWTYYQNDEIYPFETEA